jgi:hypothetical protein
MQIYIHGYFSLPEMPREPNHKSGVINSKQGIYAKRNKHTSCHVG